MTEPKTPAEEHTQPVDASADAKNQPTDSTENSVELASETEQATTDDDAVTREQSDVVSDDNQTEADLPRGTDIAQVESENDAAADPAAHDDVDLESGDDQDVEDVEKGDPYGGHEHEQLKRILEGALFASGATLSVSHLRDMFELHERPHGKVVRQIMTELIALYENRGMQLIEVASGYRFQTQASIAEWISRLWEEKPQRYSRALMETIALIAYRQPITRGEIEDVRGVAVSSNIIRTLLEREWVRVVGHRDVPGRPAMYATTRQFLDYFGLKALDQLPNLSDIRDMEELNPQLDLEEGTAEAETDDSQNEITFSGMIDKLRETQKSGKTGSEFIDEKLDEELAAMDEVNASFEQALEQQRAEHEHPDLDLDDDDSDADKNATDDTSDVQSTEVEPDLEQPTENEEPLSEEEQWKVIQEKLAQQQALLEARESDPQGEENEDD